MSECFWFRFSLCHLNSSIPVQGADWLSLSEKFQFPLAYQTLLLIPLLELPLKMIIYISCKKGRLPLDHIWIICNCLIRGVKLCVLWGVKGMACHRIWVPVGQGHQWPWQVRAVQIQLPLALQICPGRSPRGSDLAWGQFDTPCIIYK